MASDKRPQLDDRNDRENREERDVTRSEPLDASESGGDATTKDRPNPPRTTTGVWTSPKFGSAGSGGAELEPGPERD
jgi:hypothetical protein